MNEIKSFLKNNFCRKESLHLETNYAKRCKKSSNTLKKLAFSIQNAACRCFLKTTKVVARIQPNSDTTSDIKKATCRLSNQNSDSDNNSIRVVACRFVAPSFASSTFLNYERGAVW